MKNMTLDQMVYSLQKQGEIHFYDIPKEKTRALAEKVGALATKDDKAKGVNNVVYYLTRSGSGSYGVVAEVI